MSQNMKNKHCSKCKKYKTIENFTKDKKRKDSLSLYCRDCNRKINKIIRKRNNTQRTAYNKKYRDLNREKYNKWEREYYRKNSEQHLQKSKKWRDSVKGTFRFIHLSAKQRAKRKKLEYSLSVEGLILIAQSQNNRCSLTLIPFDLKSSDEYRVRPFAPSIDRIDNSKGYTFDNIRIVCVIVNKARNEYSYDIFDKMCRARVKVLNNNDS